MEFVRKLLILLAVAVFSAASISAKSYKLKINAPTDVSMTRSASAGKKMVKVVAYAGSADKAIDQAMVDAVVAITFNGISNPESMENIPGILIDGKAQYKPNKKFFDKFFKKGQFLQFVSRVNDTYPSGTNNVKTSKGQKVTVLLIVDWKGLEEFYRSAGLKTQLSAFENL